MKRKWPVSLLLFLSLGCFGAERWISLLPFWEEVFDYYQMGDQIIGVSSYCPSDLKICQKKAVYGTSLAPLKEKLFLAKPTKVWAGPYRDLELVELSQKLKFSLDDGKHDRLVDIQQAMKNISTLSGKAKIYQHWLRDLESFRGRLKPAKIEHLTLVVGLQFSGDDIHEFTVAERHTYFNDLIDLLINRQVENESRSLYSQLSMEKLLLIKPTQIIFFLPGMTSTEKQKLDRQFPEIKKLYLTQHFATVPGPRVAKLLPSIVKFLND